MCGPVVCREVLRGALLCGVVLYGYATGLYGAVRRDSYAVLCGPIGVHCGAFCAVMCRGLLRYAVLCGCCAIQ